MANTDDHHPHIRPLTPGEAKQLIDSEQLFEVHRQARARMRDEFAGSMDWREVKGSQHLCRKIGRTQTSLGPRSHETEAVAEAFLSGRKKLRERIASLDRRAREMAAINRAMRLGRMPVTAASVLRRLDDAGLMDGRVILIGTNALYSYARQAGVVISSEDRAAADDLLGDARARLQLVVEPATADAAMALLRKWDGAYEAVGGYGFGAAHRSGYLVEVVVSSRMRSSSDCESGARVGDFDPNAIDGLGWLWDCPKVETIVLDMSGRPLHTLAPDPRAFVLYHLWRSSRVDRDPTSRRRDAAQATLVADLISTSLPHLRFDAADLEPLPSVLREQAARLP